MIDLKVVATNERAPLGYLPLAHTHDDSELLRSPLQLVLIQLISTPDTKAFSAKVLTMKVGPNEQTTRAVTEIQILSASRKEDVPSGFKRLPLVRHIHVHVSLYAKCCHCPSSLQLGILMGSVSATKWGMLARGRPLNLPYSWFQKPQLSKDFLWGGGGDFILHVMVHVETDHLFAGIRSIHSRLLPGMCDQVFRLTHFVNMPLLPLWLVLV